MSIRSFSLPYNNYLPNQHAAQAPLPPPISPPRMPSPCLSIPPPLTPCKLRAPPAVPLLLCILHAHIKCLNGQTMPMGTSIKLSKWRRSNVPNIGMILFGNLVPLDRYQISQHHKCQAISLIQVCCLLQTPFPLNLTAKQMLNSYSMKGELDWLHFWCQRQYHTRQILQKLSLFVSGLKRTFRCYQLQYKRNRKLHVNTS